MTFSIAGAMIKKQSASECGRLSVETCPGHRILRVTRVIRYLFRVLLLAGVVLAALADVAPGFAQSSGPREAPEWREQRTRAFALVYVLGEEASAQEYAGFIDEIYDEVAAVFAHKTATPVRLRLYPTMELYYQANPQARNVAGVVAHANSGRREISVALPQTERQTDEEIRNNIRHELTHLVISDLSDDRLNAFFHEGIAQYLEHPSGELDSKVLLLREAMDSQQLLRWSDFNSREAVYGQPQLAYPQSLSVVAFLVDRFGFASLREFLEVSARSSGYRSALERTFEESPDTLETEWRAWLPSYIEGGYKRNALTAYDLSHIEALLGQGRYDEALTEVDDAIKWLEKTEQRTVLEEAQVLQSRARSGQRAQGLALQAREALEAADYSRAQELVAQARNSYRDLGDSRQQAVLDIYAERAERGVAALQRLADADNLARRLRYPEARAVVDGVAAEFQALGDSARAAQAEALRRTMDSRQTLLGYAFLLLGMIGVVTNLWQRLTQRRSEAW